MRTLLFIAAALALSSVPASSPKALSCLDGPWIVFFDQDVSIMNKRAREVADAFAASAGNCGYAKSVVIGHADTTEDIFVAHERSEVVAEYLAAHGIPRRYIATTSVGDTIPRRVNDSQTPQPENRRVEISWGAALPANRSE